MLCIWLKEAFLKFLIDLCRQLDKYLLTRISWQNLPRKFVLATSAISNGNVRGNRDLTQQDGRRERTAKDDHVTRVTT